MLFNLSRQDLFSDVTVPSLPGIAMFQHAWSHARVARDVLTPAQEVIAMKHVPRRRLLAVAGLMLLCATGARGHDFWLVPNAFYLASGDALRCAAKQAASFLRAKPPSPFSAWLTRAC